ncbi:MAG: hypothetical protein JO149_04520, partial [Gammaproteobacteria bacterium]|nr:hypothetical protein [Gammaproteobacteria bacterium]
GYGKSSAPMGLLLEKTLEYYVDLKELNITVPWKIFSPGTFFPLTRLFHNPASRIYSPNGILSSVSGGRSVFMLPKIGCLTNHFLSFLITKKS